MHNLFKTHFSSILPLILLGISLFYTSTLAADTTNTSNTTSTNQSATDTNLYTPLFSEENILESNPISISGFGTLAITSAGDDNLGYHRELTQKYQTGNWSLYPDSLVGFQLDWQIMSNLNANFQAVIKDRARNDFDSGVNWANLKYNLNDEVALRAGRMAVDIYMLSEYRNTAYAYLWARPIEEFYKPGIFSHFDGADIAYTKSLDEGYIQLKIFGGNSQVNLTRNQSHSKMEFSDFMGFNVLFENQAWKFRLGASRTTMDKMEDPMAGLRATLNGIANNPRIPSFLWPELKQVIKKLSITERKFAYYSLGFSYDNSWQIQSELAYLESDLIFFPSSYSGYLSVGKQINQFTPYVVFSKIQMENETYQVPAANSSPGLIGLQGTVQELVDQMQMDQETWSVGVRWDFSPKLAIKAQWSHTSFTDNKTGLWAQINYPDGTSSMDTYSLSLDFIF